MIGILIVLFVYVLCSVWCIGLSFAYWQRNWPYYNMRETFFREDIRTSLLFGLTPVIGWGFCLMHATYWHGWLWPWSDKAKKEAGLK